MQPVQNLGVDMKKTKYKLIVLAIFFEIDWKVDLQPNRAIA